MNGSIKLFIKIVLFFKSPYKKKVSSGQINHFPHHWTVERSCERCVNSPGSRLRTSTDSFRGEMLSAATTHSALRPRLYSTRKAVIGEPPLALGIQVTYAELSVAMEMVGRSGASGTGEKKQIGIKLVPVITASEFMQT